MHPPYHVNPTMSIELKPEMQCNEGELRPSSVAIAENSTHSDIIFHGPILSYRYERIISLDDIERLTSFRNGL